MMGPSCRRRARSTRKSSSRRRTLFKNQLQNSRNQESSSLSPADSPVKPSCSDSLEDVEMCSNSGCSTPKAERFRIPEIKTCPPAPKKRRMVTSCFSRRTSISFFAPPDIELFFNYALCSIPV
ncbi:Cyclin-dependent protein kinase inhibitor SMR13 [Sesamum alatum]|uniref:Cyclin-dependent protein kinase inhibitor SMR13 n=1 Tax=Sesamum alatum TaxID=300844 RepID=A0AAE1Z4R6_9LAMI|nr:Cyclin-dependent protein kinase inhibitor SMR13 [Sesamum alatum]